MSGMAALEPPVLFATFLPGSISAPNQIKIVSKRRADSHGIQSSPMHIGKSQHGGKGPDFWASRTH